MPGAGEVEPFKTLYFHMEDSPSEMRKVFEECGGVGGGWLIPYTKPLELDENGLDELGDILGYFKPSLVVFDVITSYLPRNIKAMFDNVAITHMLNRQREVYRTHKVCGLNVRHFKQGRQGVAIEDWGAGGEAWRNCHRSQLVMVPSLKRRRTAGIFHTKGSLVSATGAPFGYTINQGEFGWLEQIDPAEFGVDDERFSGKVERGERGPVPKKLQAAIDALVIVLSRGPMGYGYTIQEVMKRAECSERVVCDARRKLDLVFDKDNKTLALPEGFDAFTDAGESNQGGTL
jgi:hypothetical protein